MRLIIIGAPGSGKGTQAKLIAANKSIAHISTGDILREAIRKESYLGKTAQTYIDRGKLVPDKVIIKLTFERLEEDDCKNGFILDGFPRTLVQAEELFQNQSIDFVININIEPEILISRVTGRRSCPACGAVFHIQSKPPAEDGKCVKCGTDLIQRIDDTEEILKQRLKVYFDETKPLIEYYDSLQLIIEINGNQDIETIQKEIHKALSIILKE